MPTPHFTEHELMLISFKLASDNNAMLRMLLENQLKIMDKLGISDAASILSYESVSPPIIPLPEKDFPSIEFNRAEFESNIQAANIISQKLIRRSWEWLQKDENKAMST